MAYTPPWQRLCDCRCPLHHGQTRTEYAEHGCGCLITCATQPMTLIAEQWGYALFLNKDGRLLAVSLIVGGSWEWGYTAEFDNRGDSYHASLIIEHLLHASAVVLRRDNE
jgi:hypothetical protein